mgnify:CR=1 FL=1
MTKINYILDWKFNANSGVAKKVLEQVEFWRSNGLNVDLIVITKHHNLKWWKPIAPSWRRCRGGASATSRPTWRRWPSGWPTCGWSPWTRWPGRARPTPARCLGRDFTVYDDLLAWQRVLVFPCLLQPESAHRVPGAPAHAHGAVSFRYACWLSAGLKRAE